MRVLIVEDDELALQLVRDELRRAHEVEVATAATLETGISMAQENTFDCAVLDLSLPDGWGLDSLLKFRRALPELPVVVLSGTQGEAFEAKARRAGASDFLNKGDVVDGDVGVAVVGAVERARREGVPADQVESIAESVRHRSPISARLFGQIDMREMLGDRFDSLVERYTDLLELALERTAFQGEYGVGDHLRALAGTLGSLGAGPRDVVQIHAAALTRMGESRQGPGAPAFAHEARLVVLELMGYLVSYYRSQSIGADADARS